MSYKGSKPGGTGPGGGTVEEVAGAIANGFEVVVGQDPTVDPLLSVKLNPALSNNDVVEADGAGGVKAGTTTGTGNVVRDTAPTVSSPVVNTAISGSAISDDSTFASPSSTKVPTTNAVKTFVDNALTGLKWKAAVIMATTANGVLATAFANGQTVDGVVLTTGDRILIKNQSVATENGIYTVNAVGAPTRSTDADTGSELVQATVFVEQGTVNADTQWTCTNNSITIGVTNIVFAQVAGAGTYTNGTGITLTGNVFAIDTSVVARKSDNLSVFAATTSAQLRGLLSDETGGGLAVFNEKPTFIGTVNTVVAMGALAVDGNAGSIFTKTIAGTSTFTQSNFTVGQCFMMEVTGAFAITWFSGITWVTSGGTAPTQAALTTYGFRCTGTNTFLGYLIGTQ